MGFESVYRCRGCGHTFRAREGGGFVFDLYRCVDCDSTKSIVTRSHPHGERTTPTEKQIGICRRCGGELRNNLRPMCRKCRSRDVEIGDTLMCYD